MGDFCCDCLQTIDSCSCGVNNSFTLEYNEIVFLNMLLQMFAKTGKSKGIEQRIEEGLLQKFNSYFNE